MIKNLGCTPKHKGVATLYPPVKSNPYRKFIKKQIRNIEKHQNLDEEQLEKDSEEEIMRIATKFCREVQAWDEADAIVTDTSSSAHDSDKKVHAESLNSETLVMDKDKRFYYNHLSDPVWVAKLFRVDFNPLWMQGFMRELEAETYEDPLSELLGKYDKEYVEIKTKEKREKDQ